MPARSSTDSRSSLARRILWLQAAVVLAVLALAPFAGTILVLEDQLERADAIYVHAGGRASRWLEGRDLFNEGYAPILALSAGPLESSERVAARQGARLASEGELARAALVQLGVPADQVLVVPGRPDNTAEEAAQLSELARARGWRTVIVVTSKLHTRRAALALRRSLGDAPIRIIMRSTRYDDDDPARWWRKRRTIRHVLYEAPKLVAYLIGLGT